MTEQLIPCSRSKSITLRASIISSSAHCLANACFRHVRVKSGSWYFVPPPGGATGTVVGPRSSRRYTDCARATITRDIYIGALYSARTKSQLNKQAKHTTFYNFAERISFAEHWKLVAESSEFHLTLSIAYRAHFFQFEIPKKIGTI